MANEIFATVTSINGQAYARNAEGERRELRPGDVLFEGETLVTPDGGSAELSFVDGSSLLVSDVPEIAITGDLMTGTASGPDESAVEDETVQQVLAALESGQDIGDVLEAPAAGPDAAAQADQTGQEGLSFIRLGRIVEQTSEFAGIAGSASQEAAVVVDDELVGSVDAVDDSSTTGESQPVVIDVQDNDDFQEGSYLTAVTNGSNGSVVINGDNTVTYSPEAGFLGTDTFTYTATSIDGIGQDTAVVTVVVNSEPLPPPTPPVPPTISITDDVVVEGETATLTISLSKPWTETVSVQYSSSDGSAVAPGDYDPVTGLVTITFAPGETSKDISVSTNVDNAEEETETFDVNLSSPTNATIADETGVVAIENGPVEPPTPTPTPIPIPIPPPGVLDVEPGNAEVNEAGLPARSSEAAGSNEAANSETTEGTITYTAEDGPAVVTISGVAVASVGQTVAGASGTLTVTSIAVGSIGYSYTLTDNTLTDPSSDTFAVVVTDADGDFQSGNLSVTIVDDTPVVGDFVDFSVTNAIGVTAGAANTGFVSGADDWSDISITGEAIDGLTYRPLDVSKDASGNVLSVTLTAQESSGSDDVFSFTVMADGTQSFNLIKPEAEIQLGPILLSGTTPGGTTPFLELEDGSVEFSGIGWLGDNSVFGFGESGVYADDQGMGVGSDAEIDVTDSLTLEFYHPGSQGDDIPDSSSANAVERPIDSVTFTVTSGGGPLTWKVYNTLDDTEESGQIVDASPGFTIDPTIDFNKIEITGEVQNFTQTKLQLGSLFTTETLLPVGETIVFNVTGTDGDGDVTSSDDVTVQIVADGASTLAFSAQDNVASDVIVQTDSQEAQTAVATGASDTLSATGDADVFVWSLADNTVEGDQIVGFNPDADAINIADLLDDTVDTTEFSSYLDVSLEGDNTVIKVSNSGDFENAQQTITVQDVNLFEGIDFSDSAAVSTALQNMIDAGKLITD